jgi:hypothetical protein
LFALNLLIVSAAGYASPGQDLALLALLGAASTYAICSSLLIAVLAGEPRTANIVSGFVLGPVVPLEGLILVTVPGLVAITTCAVVLIAVSFVALLWSMRLLSFERLLGAA